MSDYIRHRRVCLALGLGSVALGVVYYLLFRGLSNTILGSLICPDGMYSGPYFSVSVEWLDSLPTFFHVTAFSFLTLAIGGRRYNNLQVSIFWTIVNILFELVQRMDGTISGYLSRGTFSWWDIGAALLAGTILSLGLPVSRKVSYIFFPSFRFVSLSAVFGVGLLAIMGSTPACEDGMCTYDYPDPVYMTYEELRQPLKATGPTNLESVGKIYVYDRYLFVNAPNKGIHIFDNADPTKPVNKAYIPVPGNLDIAIKDGYLYADSYVDLVVFDLSDPENIKESNRIVNSFPYDPYQNLPDGVWLGEVDENLGVVVGYKEEENL